MSEKTYVGRLACDGKGNLLAHEAKQVGTKLVQVHDADGEPVYDEAGNEVMLEFPVYKYGKDHGKPIAYDAANDCYVFLKSGDPSHNDQHHQQLVEMTGTQDQEPDLPGYAGTPDNPSPGMEHHWGPLPDDAHYSEGAKNDQGVVTNTALVTDSDQDAIVASSHTDQPREAS